MESTSYSGRLKNPREIVGVSTGSYCSKIKCTPNGTVNPFALALLKDMDFPIESLRSKSWDEFTVPASPHFDFIITVCDNAAGETCPVWLGKPTTAHWGIPDPAAVEGTDIEKKAAFAQAFKLMSTRINLFLSLPLSSIDQLRTKQEMDSIGKTPVTGSSP